LKKMPNHTAPTAIALAVATFALQMSAAMAQTAPTAKVDSTTLNLDEVVITASPEGRSKMKQSQSVSTLSEEAINSSGATTAAEILRAIPGVRSEASSGDGNANITVRGVPISAGGSRYVQIQEDGLPVLLFGDFDFATTDTFTRVDFGTDGVEVVRGGGASTLASNSPGGIINFLSKTGEVKGGSVGVSLSSNRSLRADFAYGGKLTDTTRFQVSGYARDGEGPRDTGGLKMERGYQLRANATTDLGGGSYVRFNFKTLDDRSPTLLTVPVKFVNGEITQIPGVDPRTYTPYSNGLRNVTNWGVRDGGTYSINEGLHAISTAVGAELSYNLGDGWNIKNNFRTSSAKGMFAGVMPHNDTSASLPAGQYTGLLLGAKFNDLGLTANDLKASKKFKIDGGAITTTAGLFLARQKYNTDWDIAPFDLTLASPGAVQTSPFGGATSTGNTWHYKRFVDMTFNRVAPYVAVGYEVGALNLDASLRHDRETVSGVIADPTAAKIDYHSANTAYSLGANYSVSKDVSVFSRVSSGATFNSDRVTGAHGAIMGLGGNVPVNKIDQFEAGVKFRAAGLSNFVTLFNARTNEVNSDLASGGIINSTASKYKASGLEYEFGYRAGVFGINGGATYTSAKVVESSAAALVGKTPNRQAKMVYQLSPRVSMNDWMVGASLFGTTASKDEQASGAPVTLPAYYYMNLFANYKIGKSVTVSGSVNNLLNTLGYTEANNDGSATSGRAAARSITGRTFKVGMKYDF
jgi:outer membrane receptor protein involved in Fe transport